MLSSFCLCLFVEEDPISEVDLPCSELAVVVELGLPFVVLCSELRDKSFFFKVVEVSSAIVLVLCLVIGGYS